MGELMPRGPKLKIYANARLSEEQSKAIDRAIQRTLLVKSTDGERSKWMRDAGLLRAAAEADYLHGHLAAVMERYQAMLELERPDWPRQYWEALIKSTQEGLGHIPGNERLRPVLLRQRLIDLFKESAAGVPVIRAFDMLRYPQVMAALDVCERHWAAVVRGEDPPPLPGQGEAAKPAKKAKS